MNILLLVCILATMPFFVGIYIKANQAEGQEASRLYNLSIIPLVNASVCYLALYFFPLEILRLPWESHLISVGIGVFIGIISYGVGISAKQEIKKRGWKAIDYIGCFCTYPAPLGLQ